MDDSPPPPPFYLLTIIPHATDELTLFPFTTNHHRPTTTGAERPSAFKGWARSSEVRTACLFFFVVLVVSVCMFDG